MGHERKLDRWIRRFRQGSAVAFVGVLSLGLAAAPVAAQENEEFDWSEYEYEPGEGLHEEEWYDPSDWFDDIVDPDEGISYEREWWDYGYYDYYGDYGYYDEGFYDGDYDPVPFDTYPEDYDVYDTYDYDYDYDYWDADDDFDYGWHYDWSSLTEEWESDYGWHSDYYDYDEDFDEWEDGFDDEFVDDEFGDFDEDWDYGWHYDWNTLTDEWERDYGWHTDLYEYHTSFEEQEQREEDERRAQGQQQQQRTGSRTLQGQIAGFRHARFEGVPDRHTLVKVRLEKGRSAVIDLGPKRDLDDLDLQQGDRIRVRGRRGTVDGKAALMAETIRVNGRTLEIRRQRTNQRGQKDQTARRSRERQDRREARGQETSLRKADRSAKERQRTTVRGTIEEFRRVNVNGSDQKHTVAKLRLESGKVVAVDFGPGASLENMDVEKGDCLVVRGRRTQLKGRPVVIAKSFRSGQSGGPQRPQKEAGDRSQKQEKETGGQKQKQKSEE